MVDANKAVTLVIALLVMGLMSAFLMPVVIDSMAGDSETTATQEVDEKIDLQPGLNATVTSVTAGTSATYAIDAGEDTANPTVNEGENETVTVDGVDVTIALTNVTSTEATTTYSYPTTYGWGGGASALWAILPVILVLTVFLYFVAVALGYL